MLKRLFPQLWALRGFVTSWAGRAVAFYRRKTMGRGTEPQYGLPVRTVFDFAGLPDENGVNSVPGSRREAGEQDLDCDKVWSNDPRFLERCRKESRLSWPASCAAELTGAHVVGPDGVVVDRQGGFLFEFCRRPGPRPSTKRPYDHPVYTWLHCETRDCREGRSLLLSGSSPDVYFHWILDILPKWELLKGAIGEGGYDRIIVGGKESGFKKETLSRAGVDLDKVSYLGDQAISIAVDDLIAVTETGGGNHFPPQLMSYLKSLFPERDEEAAGERIFFDRKDATRRRLLCPGYREILANQGFRILDASDFTVAEQASLVRSASVVSGVHGSAFANLAFAGPGTAVIEVMPGDYLNPVFWRMGASIGRPYASVVGRSSGKGTGNILADVILEPEELELALATALEAVTKNGG